MLTTPNRRDQTKLSRPKPKLMSRTEFYSRVRVQTTGLETLTSATSTVGFETSLVYISGII